MESNVLGKHYWVLFVPMLLVIVNAGCKNENADKSETTDKGNGFFEIKNFNAKGHVKLAQEFFKDSTGNFIANGFYKEFYDNGDIKTYGFFKYGKKDSSCTFYSEKGNVIAKQNYSEGIVKGKQYLFYDNGNIKRIKFSFSDTLSIFYLNYSIDGEITSTDGTPILVQLGNHKKNYNPYDTLTIINFVATIEKMKTILKIAIYSEDGECYYNNAVYKFLTREYMGMPFNYFEKQFKRGKNKYVATVELRDSATDKILIVDSNVIDVIVK